MNRVSLGDWLVERLFFLSKASMVQLQIPKSCTFKSPFRPSSVFPRQGCFEALKSVPSLQHSAFLGLKLGLSKGRSWRGKRVCLPDQKFDVQPSSWGKAVGSSKHIGDIRSTNGYQDNQTIPNQYIDGHVDVVKVAAYKWAKNPMDLSDISQDGWYLAGWGVRCTPRRIRSQWGAGGSASRNPWCERFFLYCIFMSVHPS